MSASLELQSSLTDRFQTTVPAAVRKALKLGKRDKIRFSVQPDGAVVLSRITGKESSDPVLGHFLQFLAKDMEAHPRHLQAVDVKWLQRMKALVRGVKIDLHERLSPDSE